MVDKLRTLDILLQLQGELFEDTLKEAVSPHLLMVPKWFCLSPFCLALLVIFAYEKCTGKTVSLEEMKDGWLGAKLQDCGFGTATQVKPIISLCYIMKMELKYIIFNSPQPILTPHKYSKFG